MILHKTIREWVSKFKPGTKFKYINGLDVDRIFTVESSPILDTKYVEWFVEVSSSSYKDYRVILRLKPRVGFQIIDSLL